MATRLGSARTAAAAITAGVALLVTGCGSAPPVGGAGSGAAQGSFGGDGFSASGRSGGAPPDASSSSTSGADQQDGSGAFGDLSVLPTLSSAKVCALVPDDIAAAALGAPVVGTPDGIRMKGLGTNCIWESHQDMSGPEVKLEFGDAAVESWKFADALSSMMQGKKSLTIGGLDAVEATDDDGNVACWVKLGGDDDTTLAVNSPDAAGCAAVATAALNNLAKGH